VLMLDIDHFKEINDSMGHDIGDELLKEFTSRIKRSIRKSDFLARLGGDEFVIILPQLSKKQDAKELAERIFHSLKAQWNVNDFSQQITSSIGIAFYRPNEMNENSLLKNADLALYDAKKKGRNNIQIYES